MAQQINDKDDVLNEVNVIPLADLSLVLLIILMVLSPMASQALIQVAAAKAAAAQTQEELPNAQPETPIIVSFAPGSLKLNGTLMGSDMEFVTRLGQLENCPYRRVVGGFFFSNFLSGADRHAGTPFHRDCSRRSPSPPGVAGVGGRANRNYVWRIRLCLSELGMTFHTDNTTIHLSF